MRICCASIGLTILGRPFQLVDQCVCVCVIVCLCVLLSFPVSFVLQIALDLEVPLTIDHGWSSALSCSVVA